MMFIKDSNVMSLGDISEKNESLNKKLYKSAKGIDNSSFHSVYYHKIGHLQAIAAKLISLVIYFLRYFEHVGAVSSSRGLLLALPSSAACIRSNSS